LIEKSQNYYYVGFIKIELNSTNGGYILGSKVEYELSDKSSFKYSA
jgi:pSer/pThr/pTyr-binding forkhead associated (FHA) protein